MEIFKVGDLYHVGIAVRNASDTAKLYQKTLGLIVEHDETVPDQGVRAIMLVPKDSSSSAIELLEPVVDDSSISKFLEKRGEGMHHICYEVPDISAACDHLTAKGARVLGDGIPKKGAHGNPVLFLHPKDFNGTLIELEEVR